MKYIVYATVNLINKKFYVGVHKTENPDIFDGYLGAGSMANNPNTYMNPKAPIQAAIRKYGPKNFKRVTLKVFDKLEDGPYKTYQLSLEKVDKLPEVESKKSKAKPVRQLDLNGNFIKVFKSIKDAIKEYGTGVSRVLQGQLRETKGYIFEYV